METDAQNKAISHNVNNAASPQGTLAIISPKPQEARPNRNEVTEGESSGAIASLAFCDGLCRQLEREPARCGGHGYSGPPNHFGAAQAACDGQTKGKIMYPSGGLQRGVKDSVGS